MKNYQRLPKNITSLFYIVYIRWSRFHSAICYCGVIRAGDDFVY